MLLKVWDIVVRIAKIVAVLDDLLFKIKGLFDAVFDDDPGAENDDPEK